jgi:hypothetical protein
MTGFVVAILDKNKFFLEARHHRAIKTAKS